jgi:hypothetical protein
MTEKVEVPASSADERGSKRRLRSIKARRLESKEPPSRPSPGSARQHEVRASGSGAGDLSCRLRIARKIFPSHPDLQSRVRIGEQTQAHRTGNPIA